MALAQLVTVNAGDRIRSVTWNNEIQNILTNPIALISPSTGAINFNLQAHTGLLPTAITATSGTPGQVLTISAGGTPTWATGQASPSRVMGLLGAVSSQTGTFSADAYVMRSTAGTQSWTVSATSSFSASVGIAGPAAGGRDIAGAFASTYVHWYAITTGPNSTAPAAIVSTNPPTVGPAALPGAYSGWTYLGGSVYSSSSTSVNRDHRMRGAWTFYDAAITEVTNGNSTAETTVSKSANAPPNHLESQHSFFTLLLPGTGNGQTFSIRLVSGSDFSVTSTMASVVSMVMDKIVRLPNVNNAYMYLYSSTLVSANDGLQAKLLGYKNPNGGE